MAPGRFVVVVATLVALTAIAGAHELARSRTIFLRHDGALVAPGDNDALTTTSALVKHPVEIPAWTVAPDVWGETVACVAAIYAPFAVTVTDVDPGDAPHVEGIFGGSPALLGLSRDTAGISPFSSDCSVIESSVVFAFTDILAGDARSACRVMAQELGHSYGLDHELLLTDAMSYGHEAGDRSFHDADAACGETTARPCGLAGSTCRATQNSYALLADRLGVAGEAPPPDDAGGCSSSRGQGWALLLVVLAFARKRR